MIRARVLVPEPEDLLSAYEIIDVGIHNREVNVIGIQNNLANWPVESNIILNVIYYD